MKYAFLCWAFLAWLLSACSHKPSSTRMTRLTEQSSSEKNSAATQPSSDSLVMTYVKQWLEAKKDSGESVLDQSARKLYEQNRFYPVWLADNRLKSVAEEALRLIASSEAYGLEKETYAWEKLQILHLDMTTNPAGPPPYATMAQFDLSLTRAVMQFSLHLHQGKIRFAARKTADGTAFSVLNHVQRALLSGMSGPDEFRTSLLSCQPDNREYRLLQQSLARWVQRMIPPDSLVQQKEYFRRVAVNLDRWRSEPILDSEYVFINIPAFQLQVVRQGQVVASHRIIVGKPSSPTPTLSSQITHFTASPEWHVPQSIAANEMLPQIKRNPGYLSKNNLQLYDRRNNPVDASQVDWSLVTAKNFSYVIRQSAGCDNALGNIVFRFDNPYSVYLHDTPSRNLFARSFRALSHGCIRLENPLLLARLLLERDNNAVLLEKVNEFIAQEKKRDFRLKRPLPIHIRYATITSEGADLAILKDLYGLDEPLLKAFDLYSKARTE